jgi:hypothetical protein
MSIPLTVRCECGETLSVILGDQVTCACARRYDTSSVPRESFVQVRAAQLRVRLYTRIGVVLVAAAAVLGWWVEGPAGAALAAPAAALLWFRFVQPRFKRRQAEDLAALPTWKLEAE